MIAAFCQLPFALRAVCRALVSKHPRDPFTASRDCPGGRRACLEKLRQDALADTNRFLNRALSAQQAR